MGEQLIKPYQISVWEDRLIETENGNYYDEVKIAVIGSDTMTSKNRVYSPVFKINTNGEKTLTFSLKYKYYDEMVGDFVVNPFEHFLVNERKVKLFYKNEWHDFVIKTKEEESEEYTFSYTCTDAFVQELARNGYGVTFNTDLGNNQGTVVELAEKTLENTDWIVDKEKSDILQQKISEPIYDCVITGTFEALNTDTNEIVTIGNNAVEDSEKEHIYIFYSHIANKQTIDIQFLRAADRESWSYDSNNSIIGTNYRILGEITYTELNNSMIINYGTAAIKVGPISTESQGYRLVYNILNKYDPIMGKTVDIYEAEYSDGHKQEIYHYKETQYGTSSILTNYITNNSNYTTYNGTNVTGWSNAVDTNQEDRFLTLALTTEPQLTGAQSLAKISELKQIKGFLELEFPQNLEESNSKYQYSFFNSGVTDNAALVGGMSKGEKFILRLRYNYASERHGKLHRQDSAALRAVIAGYENVEKRFSDGSTALVKKIDEDNIYLDFDGTFQNGDIVIKGGRIDNNNNYILNGVIQAPSTKYIYEVNQNNTTTQYVWNPQLNQFTSTFNTTEESYQFTNYIYTVGTAKQSISQSRLSDPTNKIGLFIYRDNTSDEYVYLEDIQITKYYEDADNNPIFIGSAPETKNIEIDKFYLKPEDGTKANTINLYNSVESLADGLNLDSTKILPLKNEKCEKILSIEESRSNCFNILQTLCETFECWLKIDVEHDATGKIVLDNNYRPNKRIYFKEYVGKDNFAGFKYGINLTSINRSIDSEEFVTKLIVGQSASEYTSNGILSITDATSNPSGESYILNFNYYLNQGLIENKEKFNQDINEFNSSLKEINGQIQFYTNELISASAALEHARANRNVYADTAEVASEKYAQALSNFETVVGQSYADFVASNPDPEQLEKNTALRKQLNDIYAAAVQVNNSTGLLTNINKEFNDLNIKCNGIPSYNITIATYKSETEGMPDTTKITLSDYIEGFECILKGEDDLITNWTSQINKKDFDEKQLYNYLIISKIPENYEIEYVVNGVVHHASRDSYFSFEIFDISNNIGMTRNLRLVPIESDEDDEEKIGLNKKIDKLIEQKKALEKDFYAKYSRFIQEGTWESTDYIDSELYFLDALQVSNASAQPKVSYTINVVEVSELEGLQNYDFNVGDRTYIEDTDFFGWQPIKVGDTIIATPIKEMVIVSEVEWHLDEPETNVITVQNYKTQFEDLFQRISATVQSVQYNQAAYMRAASILDANGNIDSTLLVGSLNAIAGENYDLASGGILKITPEGLIVRNLTEPQNLLIIKSRGIERSTDGGRSWKNLVSAAGVNTEELTSGSINTQNITVLDGDNPSFRWDANGISAFGYNEDGSFDLNTYVRYDKYGIYGIQNGEDYIASSLEDIKDKANFGLTWDGFFIKNRYRNGYVSISSTDDFQVVENGQERIRIGATDFNSDGITPNKYGIVIKNKNGEKVFETDDRGDIQISGTIRAAAGKIGGFDIQQNSLQSGEFGKINSVFISPGYESDELIAGFISPNSWAITVGDSFGVDTTGRMYATGAQIRGTIYADNGSFSGNINATSGTFLNEIQVGSGDKYIVLQGYSDRSDSLIASSDYIKNSTAGWAISGAGDAIFNNVSVRGAIKTAVFEYSEIEAVGGAFLFRPSSSIKRAEISGTDLILTLEKPNLFQENEWIKVSNVNSESSVGSIINDGGLTHVYKVKKADGKRVILEGAAADFSPASTEEYEGWGWVEEPEPGSEEAGYIYSTVHFSEGYEGKDHTIPQAKLTSWVDLKNEQDIYIELEAPRYEVLFDDENVIKKLNVEIRNTEGDAEPIYNEVEVKDWDKGDDSRNGIYIIHRYIGNLNVFFPNTSDTGESFLVADVSYIYDDNGTEREERYTRIYSNLSGVRNFVLKPYENKESIEDLEGGSLISFGYHSSAYRKFNVPDWSSPKTLGLYELVEGSYVLSEDESPVDGKIYYKAQYENGIHNYGIGINSSDNYVGLPERAISLFESEIHPERSVKVTYDYKGILGTLPRLDTNLANDAIYNSRMAGTQGIFTNNMYIGDANQFIAFYTDQNGDKQLKIRANQVVFEMTDSETGESTWQDIADFNPEGTPGQDAILVSIESNVGNEFIFSNEQATLTCTVYKGTEDITSKVTKFLWIKNQANGTPDTTWNTAHEDYNLPYIEVTPSEINKKAIFGCRVTLPE